MKVLIFRTAEEASRKVSETFIKRIHDAPDSVLGLATGGTMEPVYDHLRQHGRDIDFSRLTTFNLDEYVGLSSHHPQSYHHYMGSQLFNHLNFDTAKTHLPAGDARSPEQEARRYEETIVASGGIDLQLLGIGANGHIGFNEPSSSLGSRTRVKTLTNVTRQANARFFGPDENVPRYAITMGIQTILDAKEILVLSTGPGKAEASHQMIEGAVSAKWPASALQMHPNVTVVLDEAAASKLELRDYFETVHPQGQEVSLEQI